MRVLVACEFSGVLRDSFIRRGHDAMSCDLLPTASPGPHYQGDVRDVLGNGWDLMIAHPPCTDLAVSGARHFAAKRADGRQAAAVDFFMLFAREHHIPRICIENPVGIMSTLYRKPDQIIQPWQFGHDASKSTCLWLINLPLLKPTSILSPRMVCCGRVVTDKYGCVNCNGDKVAKPRWGNQCNSGQNKLGPSEDRWKIRSVTYQGIADAMAEQWGRIETIQPSQHDAGNMKDA